MAEEAGASPKNFDDDGRVKRTGTVWTASAHIITTVIGSGALSLSWAIAQLGWVAGPAVMVIFSLMTYFTSTLLSACYRSGDPVIGERNYSYMAAVRSFLGANMAKLCGLVYWSNLSGVCIAYTVQGSTSMMAIQRSSCFHNSGRNDPCHVNSNIYMISFGVAQIILSLIPKLGEYSSLSILAPIMSFTYLAIGLGLSIGKVIDNRAFKGSLTGVGVGIVTPTQKYWRSFEALGDIAFAYSYSMVLIEIQDTIKSPPSESKTMNKAAFISVAVMTVSYMLCGCFGYAAAGDSSPGNLLSGFGFYNPYWLLDIANVAIVIHLVGAYQVCCQPIFAFVERHAARRFPDSCFFNGDIEVPNPISGDHPCKLNLFKLVWRTAFVVITTLISMLIPFFNHIVGLVGAIGYWPLTVYFPMQMYIAQKSIPKWSTKWMWLNVISLACLVICLAAAAGSIAGIVRDVRIHKPFKMNY